MGRDNQPKHRHERKLARKTASRVSHDRILIVSEGAKTEPLYFGELISQQRLHTASAVVVPSGYGTQPLQVARYAHDLFLNGDPHSNRRIEPRAFEEIFVVFDRDEHDTYFDALSFCEAKNNRMLNDNRKKVPFKAIPSIPSFELWLLLHFEDIQAPIHRDAAYAAVRNHIEGYEKGMEGLFSVTSGEYERAKRNAERLCERSTCYNDTEPFTQIHLVVERLLNLKG